MKSALFLLYFLLFQREIKCIVKCNLPILQKFMLNGMKYAVPGRMKICGGVRDKCCTVIDEIKI